MRESEGRYAGRVALVTGAGGGIGSATARRLAREGARVLLADLPGERLDAVADALGAQGLACPTDVTRDEEVLRAVATAERELGGLDLLVNNARYINGSIYTIDGGMTPI